MITNNSHPNSTVWVDRLLILAKNILFGVSQPVIEIVYGIRKDTIIYWPLISWGIIFDFLVLSGTDKLIFKFLKITWLYPTNPIAYTFYVFFGVTLGFWIWGAAQARRKVNMVERLTCVFIESGLKSPMGKLPSFISDRPVDELVRKLRVTNAFMPKAKFEEAKEKLESSLQVYIDEITENRAGGTIDVLYSHYEMPALVSYDGIGPNTSNTFHVGQTRGKQIYTSFEENPHLLIGGQTGGGKSTFLRQLITTLYCRNLKFNFSLVDMKGGLEFQIFDKRDRVKVISKVPDAKELFDKLDKMLSDRLEILKVNKCKDLEAYLQISTKDKKAPPNFTENKLLFDRHVVVIDEAAELFLGGTKNQISNVQAISAHATRIAAQGRAVGIHLIIATQKPDTKAVNGQIKANLTGIVSFPMATLGASLSILGNGRAKELPAISGRAIWKSGLDQFEVQTPFLSSEQAIKLLDKVCVQKEIHE